MSRYCRNHYIDFLFDVEKQRTKTNLEIATDVMLALKFLWTSKFVFP